MNFTGKVVLITGAGSGIGRKAAIMFAERGAKVAVNDISEERGNETVEMIKQNGGNAVFIFGDVSNSADAKRIVEETVRHFGRLDILVNNAGIVPAGKVEDVTDEIFEKTMAINVKGPIMLSKYAVQEMKKQGGGVIVNVSSVAALKGIADRCVYSVSKAALLGLTKSMALDYVKYNIRVNAVCPGTTYSQGLAERIKASPDPEATLREMIARQPVGRLAKEEEIAFAILFAACDEAAFMTGSYIVIDGGATTA
ncbi:SDR family NAD(P)-dependent oxidoreductase [Pseudothermotoga thermarum]|uniref:Short-chain dehydrogenase/reductase SDR n=1 Tax=Pseudothermotoga thermarum DSM 5069 TaxID=688269 RepID=F7YYP7_9THEM|nr:SDR family oxidoreductase [Pseudothermotoga thermarum]AEH51080.1 short-chain dehydrogenase/reductase SDR [Pseudothermotoga thermarum DSM 5069]